jgi:hypothetical protein
MEYKTATLEQIFDWCNENNKLDWLEKYLSTDITRKIYPKKTTAGGKKVPDTKADPIGTRKTKPTFTELKKAFYEKFLPNEIPAPKKPKKPTLLDKFNALKKEKGIK